MHTDDILTGDPELGQLSRRHFVAGSGTAAFTLALGWADAAQAQAAAPKYGADGMANGAVDNPLVFVAISTDGTVSITCHRAEMGQGVRTGVPMIVADEMEADWAKVRVTQAPGDEAKYGNQDTDGSRTTRHFFMPMRRCGAAARQMLEAAAAAQWAVPVAEVMARNHEVIHKKTGKRLGYGALASAAMQQAVPTGSALRLKDPKDFRYIGKGKLPIVDALAMSNGSTVYGQDVVLPGMLFAVIARAANVGGSVKQFDASAALKIPGVVKVVEIKASPAPVAFSPLSGIAVIANNTWAAMKGREALKIEWDAGPHGSYDSVAYRKSMETAAQKPGKVIRTVGDVDTALKTAAKTIKADYYSPHLAQAPMEPPAATARFNAGKCEVWGCFQSPKTT
jgi:isoquinoline 1-oxidoreductase subunit beta